MPIDRDRLLEQSQSLENPLFRYREKDCKCAQVQVVGGKIVGRAVSRMSALGGLQCRLDDAGDARCHLVLKVEDIFERAVEAVGPEMSAIDCIDKLRGDAHPTACFAHRAFEDIADAKLASDPLHVDGLALIGEGRIPGDDEEPADARERGDDLLDHAFDKIFLLGIAAHVLEGQDGY
jgi:hypothetical protein